jgi:hypothetical protein
MRNSPTDRYVHQTEEGGAAQEISADLPKERRREFTWPSIPTSEVAFDFQPLSP